MSRELMSRVEAFLQSRKWVTTRIDDRTIRSSFKVGRGTMYPLIATCDANWVKLAVVPLGRLPADLTKAEKLYAQLLRWNGEIMFARFSLDEDGDVTLSVELAAKDLDDSDLSDALDVLTYYTSKHGADIKAMIA